MKTTASRELAGINPVLPVPFSDSDEIDFAGLAAVTADAIEAGADGLAILGVASEYWKFTESERRRLIAAVVESAAGKVPVVAGAGAESARAAVQYARQAEAAGASALMVLPPLLFRLPEQAIVDYYRAISDNCGLPIMVQDTSAVGCNQMTPALVARLGEEVERVRYAKIETTAPGQKMTALEAAGDLILFSGNGGLNLFDALERGVAGVMPGADLTAWFVRIWRLYKEDRAPEAAAEHREILPLLALECQSAEAFIAIVKQVLFLRGLIASPAVRGPAGYQIDEVTARQVAAWVRSLGLN
jgi:dihydrodipicolinate synthase/N-acetylneuraminate lyase